MLYTITDKSFKVVINTKGAEIQSIQDTQLNHEYIWQGAEEFWTGRAPILFPIVGGLKNKQYMYNGKKYNMPNHGIARISEFSAQYISEQEICFTLVDKSSTRTQYPFAFRMDVFYKIEANRLTITHKIVNNSDEDMPFAFGLHPAFNLDDTLENTYVIMEHDELLLSTVDTEDGFIVPREKRFGKYTLTLTQDSFDNDNTIIFDNLKSRSAHLCFKNSDRSIKMKWDDNLPILAFWSKKNAPYVCIEPWRSWSDAKEDTINELSKKKGVILLSPNDMKEISYSIEVL